MDLKDIKAIIDLMKKNSISEFELERQEFKIKLKRGNMSVASEDLPNQVYLPQVATLSPTTASAPAASTVTALAAPAVSISNEIEIKSPMIGTFYRSPSPEAGSYVEVGTEVNADTVVCIIEAMKLMNEIESDVAGEVVSILVENGQPVEYGERLFAIRPR